MMRVKFDIVYTWTECSNEEQKKHVVYCIKIHKGEVDCESQTIERRYTDFLELYTSLRQAYPWLTSKISFPRKVLLGNFSRELINSRVLSLENFLRIILRNSTLVNSTGFKTFLIGREDKLARKLLEGKRFREAKPLLEQNFRILNKIHTERHPSVIVSLCRLAACCSADPAFLKDAEKYADLALRRFDGISDVDLLYHYVPLLQMCNRLWRDLGRDRETLESRLSSLKKSGHKVDECPTLLESMLAID